MDYNSEQSQNTPPVKVVIVPNTFLVFSVLFAILSWMCSCFVLSAVFFGALSILFAVLSKGSSLKMTLPAKASVVMSIIAIIISAVTTFMSAYQVMNDPQMYQEFKQQYEAMTGISFEDEVNSLADLYNIDLPDDWANQ